MPRYEFMCEKCQKPFELDHDHLGAREGESPVSDVQEHESCAAARQLYNADGEEELRRGWPPPEHHGVVSENGARAQAARW